MFDRIVDFHRWSEWSPWEDIDPAMQRTFSGADAPSRVEIALQFIKPFKASNTTTFELVESDGATHVTWRMIGPKTFATRLMGIFMSMDKMIGRDFEKGLTRLTEAAQG